MREGAAEDSLVNFITAYDGTRSAEVSFDATVASRPHYFYGTRTHAEHEAFEVATAAGRLEIVDNVAIAPRVPVAPGDRIQVRGELVHDAGREPIVHWTHRDPAGKHADGFIRFRGQVYA